MAYSETLAARVTDALARKKHIVAKKMFGGVGFMLNGNMCVGIWKDSLIARIGPQQYASALAELYVMPFDITGKPMTGWVLVKPEGVATAEQLKFWITRATKFVGQLIPK